MGIFVAASAQNSGCKVYWVSEGRSAQTHKRVAEFNLRDAGTLSRLCETCSILISVCPPHAAEDVAIYGIGPQSWMFHGTVKNTHIFDVMKSAFKY
jgi:alkaline phosphatase